METAKTKRERIVGAVESHPRLSKVADYLAVQHNLDREILKDRFIDFLEREGFYYSDNLPHQVLCFEFNASRGEFINRTKLVHDKPY